MNSIETGPTIDSLLLGSGLPRTEAALLLGALLGRERAYLIAHGDDAIDPFSTGRAEDWFARRRSGEPIAYITAEREFYGISLRVSPDVMIPRPETERLVELALERAGSSARVLELGTGSGAIAVALARERPDLGITATDISESALTIARENAERLGADIAFVRSDWFDELGPEQFDLIVSNPPYVRAGDEHLQLGDVRFEPRLALVSGESGLDCVEAIAVLARARLRAGGWLLLEHGYDQGDRCAKSFERLGYLDVEDFEDLAGVPRVCAGRWLG